MSRDSGLLGFKLVSLPCSCEHLWYSFYRFPILSLLELCWLLWKAIKNCWLSITGDFNLLLSSVKWILIARSCFLLTQLERIWKHFCLAFHIWLILFTLKANYIWCEGKMGFRNTGALFMNFYSENVGNVFIFIVPQFTHCPATVTFHSLSSKRSEWWKWPF